MHLPKTPSFRLDGQRALVTGGGRGLGMAMAAALAEAGADVTVISRTGAEVEAVAAAIRANNGAAKAFAVDVTDFDAVQELLDKHGPFPILVNNAGINRPANLIDVSESDYDAVIDLNVRAALFVAKLVARQLIAAGSKGSIIFMGSQMGHVGGPKRTVYCASKHAIEGMRKAMACELGPYGIRVNTICPTFIETSMTRPMLSEPDFKETVLSNIKLGRLGAVEDVMGAVVFLASSASSLVTGSALLVDGGWTAA